MVYPLDMHATLRLGVIALASVGLGMGQPAESKRTEEPKPAKKEKAVPPSSESEPAPVVYQPPRRGTPRSKVGGGVRGTRALPTPLALAPDHVALTTHESPSLFWHIDGAPPDDGSVLFVFTLIEEDGIEPVAELRISSPQRAGIYRVRLDEHGVKLRRGVEYEWSISLVVDPEQRAQDVISTGYIMRVEEPELQGRPPTAAVYAELGLWYDALETLSDAIEAAPADAGLRRRRNSLLRQAKLEAAVE